MPLTAQELYEKAQLEPADFGENVDYEASPADQKAQAILYIENHVLAGSNAEISVPVHKALNDFTSPLTNAGILVKFGADMGAEVVALWDFAQASYGRSELNKLVDSNAKSYDEDSDQDRIQGNQRLQKLLDFLAGWKAAQPDYGAVEIPVATSSSVAVVASW